MRDCESDVDVAFASFYQSDHRRIERYCIRLVADRAAAADAVQEAMARAWARRRAFASEGHLRNFVYRVAHNLCVDLLRQRARVAPLDEARLVAAPEPLWGAEDRMDLVRALEHLSARQRRLLWLRYGRDLAYCDVALRVGVSPAAARVAVHRSREAIRQALALL